MLLKSIQSEKRRRERDLIAYADRPADRGDREIRDGGRGDSKLS